MMIYKHKPRYAILKQKETVRMLETRMPRRICSPDRDGNQWRIRTDSEIYELCKIHRCNQYLKQLERNALDI